MISDARGWRDITLLASHLNTALLSSGWARNMKVFLDLVPWIMCSKLTFSQRFSQFQRLTRMNCYCNVYGNIKQWSAAPDNLPSLVNILLETYWQFWVFFWEGGGNIFMNLMNFRNSLKIDSDFKWNFNIYFPFFQNIPPGIFQIHNSGRNQFLGEIYTRACHCCFSTHAWRCITVVDSLVVFVPNNWS